MDSNSDPAEPLAILWDALLSRQVKRIQNAYQSLDETARQSITAHLQRMAHEEGWHPEQRKSARAALTAIRRLT